MLGQSFVFPNDVHVAWSIMIVIYPYITGVVAGAFVISALFHVFDREVLRPVARLALVTSLCFCAFATVPLLLHLHRPERALSVMITPSATSAIAAFGFVYNTYMLLLLVEVWIEFRPTIVERARTCTGLSGLIYRVLALGCTEITEGAKKLDARLSRALAFAGVPIACALHGYVGFLFGAIKAIPWWSTPLMPIIFLASAIVSGIAAVLVIYLFISWRRGVQPDAACVRALSRYLWLSLVVAVCLETLELVHRAYEGGPEWDLIYTLLTERLAVSYVLVQVLLGSILPFLLLLVAIRPRTGPRLVVCFGGLAGVLVLVQVFAMRWNVVVGGQLLSKSSRGFVEYSPLWGGREGLIAAGVVLALPLLALWGASKVLPVVPNPDTSPTSASR